MSMDKSAIEQIQKAEAIIAGRDAIASMPLHIKPVVALPDNFKLHDMEQHLETRFRFRGSFSTQSLAAFGAYAQHHALPTPQAAFIDADKMRAKLVLNLGNHEAPGHCDNTATLTLEQTAAYKALLNIVEREKTQQEIAEFIEDWRHNLTALGEANSEDTHDEIPIVRALQAVRSITIEAVSKQESDVRNFGHTTSGMDSIDAKSKHTLPAFFKLNCEPYHELPERVFVLRLSVITRQKPALVLRIIREQEHKEQMAEEFQHLIRDELKTRSPDVQIYIGNFSA
jgi:uncharacterized protein YfdQ (DUF2303 family)